MSIPATPSLLGLPTELRLRIYEYVFEGDPWSISLHGKADGAPECIKRVSPALNVLFLCRLVYSELLSLRPSTSQICFRFCDCTPVDVQYWLGQLGPKTVEQIRLLTMETWSGCFGDLFQENEHMTWCRFQQNEPCNYACQAPTTNKWVRMSRRGLCRRAVELDFGLINHDPADWNNMSLDQKREILISKGQIKTHLCGHEFLTSDTCRAQCGGGIFSALDTIIINSEDGALHLSTEDIQRLSEAMSYGKTSRKEKRSSLWAAATAAAISLVEDALVSAA